MAEPTIDSSLIASIAEIAKHVKDVAPLKKTSHWEYMKQRQPREPLKREVNMNGARLRPSQLSEEEIVLLNQLKPGTYLDGTVSVVETRGVGSGSAIDLVYNNASQENRINHYMRVGSLSNMCKMILAEQNAGSTPTRR